MIRLSKTTEYAFRIMSFMANHEDKLFKSNDIFEEIDVPFRYLRKILTNLSAAGLLESVQGKYGGFRLGKAIDKITMLDVYKATDKQQVNNTCFFGYDECPLTDHCSMHGKWGSIKEQFENVLGSTTLKDIKDSGHDWRKHFQ